VYLILSSDLRQQYVTPSEVEDAILTAIRTHMENAPHRLINTSTGRLCDRGAQINAFKTSVEYKKLLADMIIAVCRIDGGGVFFE